MTKRHSLPALSAALVLGTACVWPSPERQLLANFFQACRVYDRTTMARMATVSCNPRTDGVVQDFDIAGVEDRQAEGGRRARDVTIHARVRRVEGQTIVRTVTATLEQIEGHWMVTGLTPSPVSQTSPAASSARPR